MAALVISLVCLALNAFFVAAEFALVKTRLSQLEPRARRGDRAAARAAKVVAKLDRYLSVTQVGITIASLGLGWVAEPAIESVGDRIARALTGEAIGPGGHVVIDVLGLTVLTFLHVLVGELVPKAIAIRHSEATAIRTSLLLRAANVVLWPVLWVLDHAQRGALRLLGIDPNLTEGALSEEEIVAILASEAGRSPAVADKRRTVARVLGFASRPVREIMVPRVDVVALPITVSGAEAWSTLERHAFSRVLLYEDTIDRVVGYLYAKDFFFDPEARKREDLRGLERQTLFLAEGEGGLEVLRMMQRMHIPLAVVVDEYGGTSGIVTTEDLIEEVFGELQDELDTEHAKIVRVRPPAAAAAPAEDAWLVDARASVADLREAGVPLFEDVPSGTIGKLVLERLAHMPRIGDVVRLADGVVAEVLTMTRRRIRRLRLRAAPTPT